MRIQEYLQSVNRSWSDDEDELDAVPNVLIKQIGYGTKETDFVSKYEILNDGTAVLIGVFYRGNTIIDYEVPRCIVDEKGIEYPVTLISASHHRGSTGLFNLKNVKSFRVPEGVTGIAGPLFCGCNNLQIVTIPSSIQHIKELFWRCPNFEEQKGGQIIYLGSKSQWHDFLKNDGVDCGFGMDYTPWYSTKLNVDFLNLSQE